MTEAIIKRPEISEKAFLTGLTAVCNVHGRPVQPIEVQYRQVLGHLMDDDEWRMVVLSVLAQEERWPVPAVFRRHLDELREQRWEEREADDRKRMLDDEAAWHKRLDEGPA
jgi:hypothetical protein